MSLCYFGVEQNQYDTCVKEEEAAARKKQACYPSVHLFDKSCHKRNASTIVIQEEEAVARQKEAPENASSEDIAQTLHEHIYLTILEEQQAFALIIQMLGTGRGSFCKKEAGWVRQCTCHHASLCLRITRACECMSKSFNA